METLQVLDNYIQVADYLNDSATKSLLNQFKANLTDHKYLLPFIGQFAAGKSKLINHMIGFELLPTKTVETTAFLTYISYGEDNMAVLEYEDKSIEQISIDRVHELDYNATRNSKAIAALYVKLNNPLFKNGLTLVDTPGVNTLINEHVKMTEDLLACSQYIVYVLGKSPSESDLQMLRQIEACKIPVIFVRTKVDMIHSCEESPMAAIISEKKDLESELGRDIKYFAVTNEKNYQGDGIFNDIFSSYMDYVGNEISLNLSSLYESSTIERLKLIKEKFLSELSRRELNVRNASSLSIEQIKNQQLEIQSGKNQLERAMKKNEESFAQRSAVISDIVSNKLRQISSDDASDFADAVNSIAKTDNYHNDVVEKYKAELPKTFKEMGDMVSEQLMKLSAEATDEIKNDIVSISAKLTEAHIDMTCDFDLSKVESINQEQEALEKETMEKIAKLESLKTLSDEKIAELGVSKEKVAEVISQYDAAIKEGNDLINDAIANHEVEYITKESKLAKTLKTIGTVADIATIFIPAKGWANVAKWAGKTANGLAKGGKLAQMAGKVMIGVGKSAKFVSKADKIIDLTKIANGAQKALGPQTSETSVFDYLSLSHWMGKIGEAIDPPSMEVNAEAEAEFKAACDAEKSKVNAVVDQRIKTMKELGLISDAIKEEEEKKKISDAQQANLKEELEQMRKDFERKKSQNYFSEIKSQIVTKFSKSVSEYAEKVNSKAKSEIKALGERIIFAANSFVQKQLDDTNTQLSEIVSLREQNMQKDAEQLQEIESYKSKLQIV